MSALLIVIVVFLAVVLFIASLLQLLYLEALRIRTREYASLEFFKDRLQDLIGLKLDEGALVLSFTKHTAMALMGVVFLILTTRQPKPLWEAVLPAIGFSWGTMIVATYLLPQICYRRSSLRWMVALVPAAKTIAILVKPFTWFLNFIYSLAELGNGEHSEELPTDLAEHIEALISAGQEEGIIEEDDRKLIQSVVAFGDKTVREVMTPRPNIVAIDASKTLEDLRQLVIHEQYSRIPVFDGTIDQIIGFVHVRDMFELDPHERENRQVRELIRPISLVPETKPVNDLLREMQRNGAHLAVVIDEYGNTAGLVTMEDMVEVIVGEIHDEHEPERDVIEEPNGAFRVSGSFDVDGLYDLLGFRPHEETESTTIGGLVTEWMGRVPSIGESVERGGIRIEVLAGNDLRVEQVRVSKSPPVGQGVEKTERN